tara:strand:+ start:3512 stop:5668 length:2157 start_codon:yes stop_codon:yes gene_type:complete
MENIHNKINICLKNFFGFNKFKGNQEEAIRSIINGNNTFVIMPTGGGKSLCYQLPAILLDGVAIIISPLIALMKNQVDSIRSYAEDDNIAHFLNSTLSKSEKDNVKNCVLNGKTKLLFLAPETINQKTNLDFLAKCTISFFAIDEAHCISEWGHDFRPEYRKLKTTIKKINEKPIIALTATATEKVKKDIVNNLGMEDGQLFISSFNRPNLYYEIREKVNVDRDLVKFVKKNENKSGIIYCLARKKSEEISEILNLNNIKSLPYHAGLEQKVRVETQDAFLMEEVNVIVATIAFGMGIDKPDVRYVIHYNLPKSLENYYQETGRCGRDGGEGQCILFYKKEDVEKFQSFNSKKTPIEKSIGKKLLEEMVSYVETQDCRRKKILRYFGENYEKNTCKEQCDNCKNPKTYTNYQNELKNILELILEVNGHFNMNQLISILQGNNNNVGHITLSELSNFNKLNTMHKSDIQLLIEKGVSEKLIEKNMENGKLKISELGKLFLDKPLPFLMIKNQAKTKAPSLSLSDNMLLEILTQVRKDLASKKNVPPFIIFQDPSLEEMAKKYPINNEELKNIIGVGAGKIKKYGQPFTNAIKEYVEENNIKKNEGYIIKSKPKKNDLKIFIIQSSDRKMPFDDIINQKNISMENLITEIESIVNSGTKINIDYHINDILDQVQQNEIKDYYLKEALSDSIEDAKNYFDQEYADDEIRLMKIKIFSDLAN